MCEELKDVVLEGKRVENIFGKLDPKTIHLINPSDNQLYETFTRLEVRVRNCPESIVLFCYNGHGVEFKDSLHALLTEGSIRTLFPIEKKLNNLGKATNVFALFNCNRMIAYGEKLRKPRPDMYIQESRVNFLYASRVGDDHREHNLAKAYYTQAEEKLLLFKAKHKMTPIFTKNDRL